MSVGLPGQGLSSLLTGPLAAGLANQSLCQLHPLRLGLGPRFGKSMLAVDTTVLYSKRSPKFPVRKICHLLLVAILPGKWSRWNYLSSPTSVAHI